MRHLEYSNMRIITLSMHHSKLTNVQIIVLNEVPLVTSTHRVARGTSRERVHCKDKWKLSVMVPTESGRGTKKRRSRSKERARRL